MIMLTRNEFAEHVLDALRHFYDPVRLQVNPLVSLLDARDSQGCPSPAALRLTLRNAITSLKPDPSMPHDSPEWLGYTILWQHYIQHRSRDITCTEIGISQASFYRHRVVALEALSDLLWNRYEVIAQREDVDTSSGQLGADDAVSEALRLMSRSSGYPVRIEEVLSSAAEMLEPVAAERGVTLRLTAEPNLPVVHGHPSLLRQIMLYLMTDLIEIPENPLVEVATSVDEHHIAVNLSSGVVPRLDLEAFRGQESVRFCRTVLEARRGELHVEQPRSHLEVSVAIPIQEATRVLVIDDDADAILLYRRYLQGFEPRFARSEQEARAALEAETPELILLDLMMPGKDGWDILGYVRGLPACAHVPVLVASVLSQPNLAISMGATAVLQKPFGQEALLAAIQPLIP